MKLLTSTIRQRLIANGHANAQRIADGLDPVDFAPVVKLFTPDAACTWLLTELTPDDEDLAFGLCDLGLGYPELGYVRLSELESVRGKLGLPVERDRDFIAYERLTAYFDLAHERGRIVA